jgi:hypothetical protein
MHSVIDTITVTAKSSSSAAQAFECSFSRMMGIRRFCFDTAVSCLRKSPALRSRACRWRNTVLVQSSAFSLLTAQPAQVLAASPYSPKRHDRTYSYIASRTSSHTPVQKEAERDWLQREDAWSGPPAPLHDDPPVRFDWRQRAPSRTMVQKVSYEASTYQGRRPHARSTQRIQPHHTTMYEGEPMYDEVQAYMKRLVPLMCLQMTA